MQVAQQNTLVIAGALVDPGWVSPAQIAACIGQPAWARGLDTVAIARNAQSGDPNEEGFGATAHDLWLRDHYFTDLEDPDVLSTVRRIAALPVGDGDTHRPGDTSWLLEPAHFHLSRDHLALLHGALASLSREDALALAEAIAPTLADAGFSCRVIAPDAWLLRDLPQSRSRESSGTSLGQGRSPGPGTATGAPEKAGGWQLRAAGSERAWGRNVDAWLPEGTDARRWRRVLNEIQMTWFEHPVNEARAARGELPVNAVWLGGPVPDGLVGRWRGAEDAQLSYDDSALQYRLSDDRDGWLAHLPRLGERIAAALALTPQLRIVLAGERETRTLARASGTPARWWNAVRRRVRSAAPGALAGDTVAGWFRESEQS